MKPALVLAALTPILLLAACHAPPAPLVSLASCGNDPQLPGRFAADLAQGRAPEASPPGACVAGAARSGSTPAALLLAASYQRAMIAAQTATNSPALELDLFGRYIGWLRLAANRGDPAAQAQLAQAMDTAPYRPMSDMALAWYQTAAENGNAPALTAIASAHTQGRILDERLYDFRTWLEHQSNPTPTDRATAKSLAHPAAIHLPS